MSEMQESRMPTPGISGGLGRGNSEISCILDTDRRRARADLLHF